MTFRPPIRQAIGTTFGMLHLIGQNWSFTLNLSQSDYRLVARAWDTSNNLDVASRFFTVT